MVKAFVGESNIKMPNFFSYIFKVSLIVLIPVFISTAINLVEVITL